MTAIDCLARSVLLRGFAADRIGDCSVLSTHGPLRTSLDGRDTTTLAVIRVAGALRWWWRLLHHHGIWHGVRYCESETGQSGVNFPTDEKTYVAGFGGTHKHAAAWGWAAWIHAGRSRSADTAPEEVEGGSLAALCVHYLSVG